MKIVATSFLFVCLALSIISFGQNSLNKVDAVAVRFKALIESSKKEKIILETDRKIYGAGEKIWFRAFVLNGLNNKIDLSSNNLFADLVDDHDNVISKLVLNNAQLNTNGAITLPDTLSSGFYWVRGYTNKILSENIENIFLQPVYIVNKEGPDTVDYNRVFTNAEKNIRQTPPVIHFISERLTGLPGISSVGVLKISDANNDPVVNVAGDVVDDNDSVLTNFTLDRLGLARIGFLNDPNRKYTAIIHFNGSDIRYPLPAIDHHAAQLSLVTQTDTNARVFVSLEDSLSSTYRTIVVGAKGDSLCFIALGAGSYHTDISLLNFPGGLASLFLFDEQMHLLAERKIYVKKDNYHIDIKANKKNYAARDKATINIKVTDTNGVPLAAILNVSVQNSALTQLSDSIQPGDTPPANEFLLNDWLALHNDRLSPVDIDMLMMTVRSLPHYLHTNEEDKKVYNDDNEKLLYLLGKITDKRDRPLKDRIISVISRNESSLFADIDTTDDSGIFKIPLPQNMDSLSLSIQVTDKRGIPKPDDKIITDTFNFPNFATPALMKTVFSYDIKGSGSIKRYSTNHDLGFESSILLKAVKVTTVKKKEPNYDVSRRSSFFSQIVASDKFRYGGVNALTNALLMVPGVGLRGDELSIFGGGPPLIIMDGAEIPVGGMKMKVTEFLNTLAPSEIDFMEVLRGAEAAMYGVKGGDGVIIINSRRGPEIFSGENKNLKAYTPVTYHVCPQFFMPDYSNKEVKNNKMPDPRNTIFWNGDTRATVKGQASVSFYTADNATNYSVTVTGLSANGDIIYKRVTLGRN